MRILVFAALLSSTAALRAPNLRRATPIQATPSGYPTSVEAAALRGCSAGWAGLAVACYSGPSARQIVQDCFGLATVTFEDNIREPAAGLLELVSPIFLLESILLVGLASGSLLSASDRTRAGGALALTSVGVLSSLAIAVSAGMPIANAAAVSSVSALVALTGVLGARALTADKPTVDEPLDLFLEDARDLLDIQSPLALFNANDPSTFYRSSTIVGILVGAAFAFSPVSPIAVFDEELPVTHMLRQNVGFFIAFSLCPIQAALFRAARDGTLGESVTRALNTATGIAYACKAEPSRPACLAPCPSHVNPLADHAV